MTNHIFAENAWYFRNALVRANYNDLKSGIHETTEYLELFLRNLLLDEKHELHNRSMHISGAFSDAWKPNIEEPKPDIEGPKPDIGEPKPDIEEPKPDIEESKPDIEEPKPDIEGPKPDIGEPKPDIEEPKPDIEGPKPDIEESKPDIGESKPDIEKSKYGIENVKITAYADKNARVAQKTIRNMRLLFGQFGYEIVFGRNEVMKALDIKSTAASELIKRMRDGKIIESVTGTGKGKYRFLKNVVS